MQQNDQRVRPRARVGRPAGRWMERQASMMSELDLGPNEPAAGAPQTFTSVFYSQADAGADNNDPHNAELPQARDEELVIAAYDAEAPNAQYAPSPSTHDQHLPPPHAFGDEQGSFNDHPPHVHHHAASPPVQYPADRYYLMAPPMNVTAIPPPGALPLLLWAIPNHTTGLIDVVPATYPLHPSITKASVATFLGVPEMVTTESSPGAIASIPVQPPPSSSTTNTTTMAQVAAEGPNAGKQKATQEPQSPELMNKFVAEIQKAISSNMRTEENLTNFAAIMQEFMATISDKMPDNFTARRLRDNEPRNPVAGPSRHAGVVWPTANEDPEGEHRDFFFIAPYLRDTDNDQAL